MVGAWFRSSRFVINKILKQLKPSYRYIVEYGAGDGVITQELLKRLPRDAKVIALEINKLLLEELRTIKDSRLVVLDASVVDMSKDFSKFGLPRIDAVISGIPFTFFSATVRKEIMQNTHDGLVPGGRFIVYQYSLLMYAHLKKAFPKRHFVYEPRNVLPYFIMVGEK